MAIRIKKVFNAAIKKYYMKAYNPNVVDTATLGKLVSQNSGYSAGAVMGIMTDVMNSAVRELQNSNQVSIVGLGTFRVKCVGDAKDDAKKVSRADIESLTIQFTPDEGLLSKLNTDIVLEVVDKSGNTLDTDKDNKTSTSEDEDAAKGNKSDDEEVM